MAIAVLEIEELLGRYEEFLRDLGVSHEYGRKHGYYVTEERPRVEEAIKGLMRLRLGGKEVL